MAKGSRSRSRSRSAVAVSALGLAAALSLSGFTSAAASGGWGKAITLPAASPAAISCWSPGNCGAVGSLGGSLYLLSQASGRWGRPKAIPGTARTSSPGSSLGGLKCFSAGNCLVVGTYRDAEGHLQAFIVTQARGTWGKIRWVPGLARLDRGHNAGISGLACPSKGNCTAVGSYTDAKRAGHPFVVSQARGTWGSATKAPSPTGLPGQVKGTVPSFGPIACGSAGNCAAAGTYTVSRTGNQDGDNQTYVIDEVNGTWGPAQAVPGLAALNADLTDSISVISCPSAGNCVAGGSYTEAAGNLNSFVVSQTNGTWGTATALATSIPDFDGPDGDWITSMSCPSAGNCLVGGVDQVERDALASSVFIASETHGTWGKAVPVPGSDQLNQGDQSGINQISCSSAGNCGIVGYYSAAYDFGFVYTQPFVINQFHGSWGKLTEVPGIKTLSLSGGQSSQATTISCPAPDRCTAGGFYQNSDGTVHAFVTTQP